MSFVGFVESYTEVFKNTDGLPAELQQAATKQNVNRLDRKMVSSAFYLLEIEAEMRERKLD